MSVPRQRDGDPAASWLLVQRAQAGEAAALEEIWRRYHQPVFRFVMRRVGHVETAQDLTGDTFTAAIRRIGSFTRPERDLGAWLMTIARNRVIDYFKCRHGHFETPYDLTGPWYELRDEAIGPDTADVVLTRARDRALWRSVAALGSDLQRRVIVLRFLRGLSVQDTARLMGTNVGVVKSLQYRAVRSLR